MSPACSSSRLSPRSLSSLPPASLRDQPAAISPGCWAQKCFQLLSVGFDTSQTSGAVVPGGAQPGLPVPESCNLPAGLLQAGTATRPHLFLAQGKGRGSSRVNSEAAADPSRSCMTAPWPFCLPLPMKLPPQRLFPVAAGPGPQIPSSWGADGADSRSHTFGVRWSVVYCLGPETFLQQQCKFEVKNKQKQSNTDFQIHDNLNILTLL